MEECHPSCLTCNGPNDSNCLSCSKMNADTLNQCKCVKGYYEELDECKGIKNKLLRWVRMQLQIFSL